MGGNTVCPAFFSGGVICMDRTDRIAEEMKREISSIIRNELKDPRLPEMISITGVNVTRDLRIAKIFASVLGTDEEKRMQSPD